LGEISIPWRIGNLEELISPKELSRILKVSKPWPYIMVKRGLLPHYKMGKVFRFRRTDIETFLNGSRVERKYSWKELRHTTGSQMHRKGVSALVIKDQLRHSNIKTTVDFYIGADLGYQREQIEKLTLKWENSGK